MKYDTTIVITSYDRHDLLERTLRSLRLYNTDKRCGRLIVVEDGVEDPRAICEKYGAELLLTGERRGQPGAIDFAYATVTTPYIFHCEDDWEFYRPGFIERSREILEADKSCVCVWLHSWNDAVGRWGHPLSFKSACRTFGVLAPEAGNHGFTFQPGLRRVSDYLAVGPFSRFSKHGFDAEPAAGREFHKLGYRAVILDETGYIRYLGETRHVPGYFLGGFRGTQPDPTNIQVDSALLNIALNKPAMQSSLSNWSKGQTLEADAGNAVDGNLSKEYGFHTDMEEHPWWMVDLGALATIQFIRIFNREAMEYVQLRASPLLIETSRDKEVWTPLFQTPHDHLFSGFSGGKPLVWGAAADNNVVARFVRISILRRECLHLAEIEVYGKYVEEEAILRTVRNGADVRMRSAAADHDGRRTVEQAGFAAFRERREGDISRDALPTREDTRQAVIADSLLFEAPTANNASHSARNLCQFPGVWYREFLAMLGVGLDCQKYFEIGTHRGDTIEVFQCDTVCVDPDFQIDRDVIGGKSKTLFFQITSDKFFSEHELNTFMPGGPDIAFLDGLHLFENVLRDFINTEKSCHERSVIALHDCFPLNARMAEREFRLGENEDGTEAWWTGDVWRVLLVLKKYRPDLRVQILDCPPTGLTACTRVDRFSRVLSDNYAQIVDEFSKLNLMTFGIESLWSLFPVVDTRTLVERPSQIPVILFG